MKTPCLTGFCFIIIRFFRLTLMILVLGSLLFSFIIDDSPVPDTPVEVINEVKGKALKPSVDLSPNGFYSFRFLISFAFDELLRTEGLLRLVGF